MGLTGVQRQPYRQTVAIDNRMNFCWSTRRVTFPSTSAGLFDAGSMLMHADNGGVDHLKSGIKSAFL